MAYRVYELSFEGESVLQALESKTGVSKGKLLSEAIALLEVFVNAKSEGKSVCIAKGRLGGVSEIQLSFEIPKL